MDDNGIEAFEDLFRDTCCRNERLVSLCASSCRHVTIPTLLYCPRRRLNEFAVDMDEVFYFVKAVAVTPLYVVICAGNNVGREGRWSLTKCRVGRACEGILFR